MIAAFYSSRPSGAPAAAKLGREFRNEYVGQGCQKCRKNIKDLLAVDERKYLDWERVNVYITKAVDYETVQGQQ